MQKPIRSGQGVSGRVSYPPGPILESVFLWLCLSTETSLYFVVGHTPQFPSWGLGCSPQAIRELCLARARQPQILGWSLPTFRGGPQTVLGRTYGKILDLCLGGRTENGHEMVLELVPGADFRCVLHNLSSLTCLKGSWGQVWRKSGPEGRFTARKHYCVT